MALDLSGISAYTDELSQELVTNVLAQADTMKVGITMIEGIKHTTALNFFDTNAVFQADACGFTSSGSTPLTQRNITVCPIAVMEALCPKDYNSYWLALKAKKGSKDDALVFAEAYTAKKTAKIAEQNELLMWQGDTTYSPQSSNLAKCDGWLKKLTADNAVVKPSYSPSITSVTVSNILTVIDGMVAAIPENIKRKDNLVLLMSYNNYDLYVSAKISANNYFQNPDAFNGYTCKIQGHPVTIVAVHGLNGVSDMVLTHADNLVLGTDLVDEVEGGSVELWYSQDFKELRFAAQFKIGVSYYFSENIVYFKHA